MLHHVTALVLTSRRQRQIAKVNNYATSIVELYTDVDFITHFRMTRRNFELLLTLLGDFSIYHANDFGRPALKLDHQCLLCLKYLGHQEGMRSLSNLFGVSVSSCNRIFLNFCNAIHPNLSSEWIKWPNTNEIRKKLSNLPHKVSFHH